MRGQAGPRRGYVELTLGCLGTRSQRDEHVSTRRCWAPQMEVRSHGTIKERNRGAIARFVATRFVHTQSLRARCEDNQELPPQHGAGFAAVMLTEGGRPSVASEPASGGFAAGIPGQGGPQSIASETASGGLAAVQMKGGRPSRSRFEAPRPASRHRALLHDRLRERPLQGRCGNSLRAGRDAPLQSRRRRPWPALRPQRPAQPGRLDRERDARHRPRSMSQSFWRLLGVSSPRYLRVIACQVAVERKGDR